MTDQQQVFISYSSKDRGVADAVRAHLQSNGVTCWMAPYDILGGSDWAVAIVDAIDRSQALLLILSAASNESADVKREVGRASHRGIPIVPFFIENVKLSQHMEYFLATTHWMGADSRHIELRMAHLLETIRTLLREPVARAPHTHFDMPIPPQKSDTATGGSTASSLAEQVASIVTPTQAAQLKSEVDKFEASFLDALRPFMRFPQENATILPDPKPTLAGWAALIVGILGVLFNLQGLLGVVAPGFGSAESYVYAMFPMIRLVSFVAIVVGLPGNIGLIIGGRRMLPGRADGPGIAHVAVRWLAMVVGSWFVASMLLSMITGPEGMRSMVTGGIMTTAMLAFLQIGVVSKLTSMAKR